ncbi:MAG: HPF/RaiA family ribosome-associated protein [Gammaproteobacteria bacterium]|nr:HPF/RaiA family ribosome-associated protein [Gammaproteobacteria bacterium]NIR83246.1 HPF/RaiA family ribosome-associated protein [Gammaproteobacteria bacterium]NIR91050.1 HPF/RaiA family ribosome-associated protein [Gammaproteobacteria bacterium]NIU04411.1 HPF/RaiA family ribosome-associated protein [Gammaproteobacteria bacterium]NIV76366.1 30S ribosomal protein S30 [Gammaproteobacteria bacterium]
MRAAFELSFRDMEPSPAIEQRVRKLATKLEDLCEDLTSCRVVVEAPHRHHRRGNLYHVRVDLTVPGEELVASRDPAKRHRREDVYAAIRDAFDAARRQLQEYKDRQRAGSASATRGESPPEGRIRALYPDEGYGHIETVDGRVVRFERDDVLGDFTSLDVGTAVRFVEQSGEEGPRATGVRIVR